MHLCQCFTYVINTPFTNILLTILGDQLVSWDSNDGLRSALTGALSSGLVGHAITHSDIGGYTGMSIAKHVFFLL